MINQLDTRVDNYIADMQNWWQKMRKRFQKNADKHDTKVPFHHGVLCRSEQFQQDFQNWKSSIAFRSRMYFLQNQIECFVNEQPTHEGVTFLHSPMSAGIVLHCPNIKLEGEEANFMLDFFKDVLLENPYRLQLKDTKTTMQHKDVITLNRYYLKPKINLQDKPYNQYFGNVYLELLFLNARAKQFKAQLNYYSDAAYQPPYRVHKFYETLMAAAK